MKVCSCGSIVMWFVFVCVCVWLWPCDPASRHRGCVHCGTSVLQQPSGNCQLEGPEEAQSLSLQEGNRNLQLLLFQHHTGCQAQQTGRTMGFTKRLSASHDMDTYRRHIGLNKCQLWKTPASNQSLPSMAMLSTVLWFPCRDWLCVWKNRFTFTTSETWKCCTLSEKLHPTPQVRQCHLHLVRMKCW